jgi:hypothetical protein
VRLLTDGHGARQLSSPSVGRPAKAALLAAAPDIAAELGSVRALERVLDAVPRVGFACPRAHIAILFAVVCVCPVEARLTRADALAALLGGDEATRFARLREAVPPARWTDAALPFAALAIADRTSAYFPLMALAHLIPHCAAALAEPLFARVAADAAWEVHALLADLLRLPDRAAHAAVIAAAAAACGPDLDGRIACRAFDATGDRRFVPARAEALPLRMLLPNRASARVFAGALPGLTPAHAAAAAHFFLSHFAEADAILATHPPA